MPQVFHNFEGGTSGTNVASGAASNSDTAGNNYFDAVSIAAPGVAEFTNTQAQQGTNSMRVSTSGGSGVDAYVAWSTQRGTLVDNYSSFMFRSSTAVPGAAFPICYFTNTAGGVVNGRVIFAADGTIRASGPDNLVSSAGGPAISADTWYRIEVNTFADAAVGFLRVVVYTPYGTVSISDVQSGTSGGAASTGKSWWGTLGTTNFPASGASVYYDYITDAASTWVGAPASPGSTNAPQVLRTVRSTARW